MLTLDKSLLEDGSSQLEEEQFFPTHGGIPAMTQGNCCELGSHPNLNLLKSLAFLEHLCIQAMLGIFIPTVLQ